MAATLALIMVSGGTLGASAASPSPSPLPCLKSLKFGGSLYLDTDSTVASSEVGPPAGETDPNPTHCGLPDRLTVYRHVGHPSTEEVVYYTSPGQAELFRSGGQTGFPMQGMLKWLVLLLVIGILLFAALPALLAHLRQPPIEVGGGDDPQDAGEPKISSDGR
jgi:hypothetical protein